MAGKCLDPLIYRSENREYEHFLPSIKRPGHTQLDDIENEIFLGVYKRKPYYSYRLNYIDYFGYHMEMNLEAVAQHYGFKTTYLDITRSSTVAEFFAYTYCDKEGYHPIADFSQYSQCVYTADLLDIYRQNANYIKLFSGQIALCPCAQFAMAMDALDDFEYKALFHKEHLSKNLDGAKNVYERF